MLSPASRGHHPATSVHELVRILGVSPADTHSRGEGE
ncbi:hypothetical protein ACVWWN_005487 [Mycobacterium sp. URHB0021]